MTIDFGDFDPDRVCGMEYGIHISNLIKYSVDVHTPWQELNFNPTYVVVLYNLSLRIYFCIFLSNLDVSDRIADPLPVPGIPVVSTSPWVSAHLHLPLNSPPFI